MPLDPEARQMLDQLAAAGMAPLHALSVAEARAFMESMRALHGPPTPLPVVHDLEIDGSAGTIPARLYRPREGGVLGLLVYFHGGGWVIGSLDTHDYVCRDRDQAVFRRGIRGHHSLEIVLPQGRETPPSLYEEGLLGDIRDRSGARAPHTPDSLSLGGAALRAQALQRRGSSVP